MADKMEKAPAAAELEEDVSEEELARVQAAGQKLIEKDAMVQSTCVTLLFAQQLYHCAIAALRRDLEENNKGDRQVEAYLTKSMNQASMKPFARNDLIKKAQGMILPWLMAELELEQKREEMDRREDEEAFEETRRAESFELPWPIFDKEGDEATKLARERSLVMVGHEQVVEMLLEQLVNTTKSRQVQGKRLVVCHLSLNEIPAQAMAKKNVGKMDYFQIGVKQWAGRMTSRKKVSEVLSPWMKFSKRHRIDMLIVDDLAKVMTKRNADVPLGYHVNETHKLLRNWCNAAGAFMVAGVPVVLATPGEYKRTKEWDMLDVYCTLRMLHVANRPPASGHEEDCYFATWADGNKDLIVDPVINRKIIERV